MMPEVTHRQLLALSAVIFLISLMVRVAVLPLQKSLERDSLGYIELAQTDLRKAVELPNGVDQTQLRSRMTVFVYLLKIGPRLGLSVQQWGHILNIFAGSVAAMLAAVIALLIFQDMRAAWFVGLLTAVEPVSVKYSLSLLREPLAFTLAAAAILTTMLWYRKKQCWSWALLTGFFSACAAIIRMEMIETLFFFWLLLLTGVIFRRFSCKVAGLGLGEQFAGCGVGVLAVELVIRSCNSVGIFFGIWQTFRQYFSRILG